MPAQSIKHMASTIEEETDLTFLADPRYRKALEWMGKRARVGEKEGLRNIRILLDKLGNPQRCLRCFHIAGTNGKGSTAEYLASVLEEAGYRTGLFTSPYIESFRERFQINHRQISKDQLMGLLEKIREIVEEVERAGIIPTHFEILTAVCFQYFADENVDFAVMEVGVGGLSDSTNVIEHPAASIITAIDYDHMDYLGSTLAEIAAHKAGIIKEHAPVFLYPNNAEVMEVVRKTAEKKSAPVFTLEPSEISQIEVSPEGTRFSYGNDRFQLGMIGSQQAANASLAVLALRTLRQKQLLSFSEQNLKAGLAKAKLMVRMEVLQKEPFLLLDGAHNIQGARVLVRNLRYFGYERMILGMGIFLDKNYREIVGALVPEADEVIATELPMPRRLPAEELAREIARVQAAGGSSAPAVTAEPDAGKALALSLAKAGPKDLILWCGSLYLAGEIRKRFLK